jgi:ribosome-associated toxin RatA of RatAB toxin-antitoxin module
MPTVRKSVIVPHAARAMFELVDRCEDYPRFLPWCARATVSERTAALTRGKLEIDFRGLRTSIATINHKRAPREIRMELQDGPFESFDGRWTFVPLGEEGCRVELAITYELASGALQVAMAPVFGYITETLVERFVERADEVAG